MADKKRIFISVVFLSAFFIFSSGFCQDNQPSPPTDFTLTNAILVAFQNNKDIQMQEQEITVASANILGAKSVFLPQINLQGSYTYNDKVLAENIFSGYENDNLAKLAFSESVYSGGANMANFKQAKISLDIQQETLRAKKLDVEFDARRLYYGLLLAYETERIAKDALTQAIAHYEDVKQMYKHGRASRFDMLQSGVQVSLLEPDVVRARSEIDSLKAELNKLLARKVDYPIETKEKLAYSFIKIDENEFLKNAYLERPEIKLKSLGVDIDKWGIQMAKSGYRPQIDILGGYSYRSNNLGNMFNEKQRNWNAGVTVNFPIFEGFSTKAKVDAAKARYAQAKISQDNLVDQVAVDIRKACLGLQESEAIIKSQKDNVEQAQEALRIAEVSYANGVAINLDVLDAQVSLAQIQKNLAAGTYDYLMAQAYLDRSMGKSVLSLPVGRQRGKA
ncbi:MAG: TolC family protein [Candidatus Omnitrophota bacterium]